MTERTRTIGEEPRHDEARLRAVFEAMAEGFLLAEAIIDDGGRVVDLVFLDANPAARRLTGAQWVGRRLSEIDPSFEARWLEAWERASMSGAAERVELHSQWMRRWLDCSITRVGGSGSRRGAIVFRDVSERRRAEEALREADRQKDELLAQAVHELRNPLAPIRTSVEILRVRGGSDPMVVRSRDVIERQVGHMARLLDDLLDVSRLIRGKLELERERASLRVLLDAAVEVIRPRLDQRGQRVALDVGDADVVVEADAPRLTRALVGLLTHAARHEDAGAAITVRAGRDALGRAVVRVGEDASASEPDGRMLEPTGSGTSDEAGLELPLARGLVELHGGTLTSGGVGPGRGSVLTVTLPLAPKLAEARASQRASEAVVPRRRILIADDNVDAADTAALLLGALGCDVRTVYDGEAAVREAERFRPELVLLDLGMPGVDGYQACRRIRSAPWGNAIRVVALSGWDEDEDRQRSARAGFHLHLTKPVDLDALVPVIAGATPSR
jgi:signal transduction histidine kinase/CheY-like chemotaxis protein